MTDRNATHENASVWGGRKGFTYLALQKELSHVINIRCAVVSGTHVTFVELDSLNMSHQQ